MSIYKNFIITKRRLYPTVGTDSGCVVIPGPYQLIERRLFKSTISLGATEMSISIKQMLVNSQAYQSTFAESLNRRLHWLGRESFPYGEPKRV